MEHTHKKLCTVLVYVALAMAAIVVFLPLRHNDFVNYDDYDHVTENQYIREGITGEGLRWAFTTGFSRNWIPLAWLSHMLNCELFGTAPGWHHLSSLFLHLVNTLLLFAVLKGMTNRLWSSGFVAAAFALHPMHVEPVAWIGAYNHIVSTFFWMLTLAAYLGYVKKPHLIRYLPALLFFALGLMTKPMVMSLPLILILLDYWPLGRLQFAAAEQAADKRRKLRNLVLEKVPFFALTAALGAVTFFLQRRGEPVAGIAEIPLKLRIINTPVAYVRYIGKMFWPSRLAVFYPHPGDKLPLWQAVAAALLLLAISIWVIRLASRHKYLLTGWFWFIVTLVPVIGLVQVGDQSAIADRYSYISFIGLFIIIAWGLPELLAKWRHRRIVIGISVLAAVLVMSICTRFQVLYWRNSVTLFEHALEATENNHVAHFCIADPLRKEGKIDKAIDHSLEALRIRPDYVKAHNSLGLALLEKGRLDEAITHFTEAMNLDPSRPEAHVNLGVALVRSGNYKEATRYYTKALNTGMLARHKVIVVHKNLAYALLQQGDFEQAIAHYSQVLQINPYDFEAHYNMAEALTLQGRADKAISHYRQALQIRPDDTQVCYKLAVALQVQGRLDEPVSLYRHILQLEPDNIEVHNNLGLALALQGKFNEAIVHYKRALQLNPDDAQLHFNLGNALNQQDKLDEAVQHYAKALQIKPDFAGAHSNFGTVLAKQGKFDEAIRHFKEALRIKPDFAEASKNLEVLLNQKDGTTQTDDPKTN